MLEPENHCPPKAGAKLYRSYTSSQTIAKGMSCRGGPSLWLARPDRERDRAPRLPLAKRQYERASAHRGPSPTTARDAQCRPSGAPDEPIPRAAPPRSTQMASTDLRSALSGAVVIRSEVLAGLRARTLTGVDPPPQFAVTRWAVWCGVTGAARRRRLDARRAAGRAWRPSWRGG